MRYHTLAKTAPRKLYCQTTALVLEWSNSMYESPRASVFTPTAAPLTVALCGWANFQRRMTQATVRLDPEDAAAARELAERRGLEFQVYFKHLLHDALQRERTLA